MSNYVPLFDGHAITQILPKLHDGYGKRPNHKNINISFRRLTSFNQAIKFTSLPVVLLRPPMVYDDADSKHRSLQENGWENIGYRDREIAISKTDEDEDRSCCTFITSWSGERVWKEKYNERTGEKEREGQTEADTRDLEKQLNTRCRS